MSEEKRKIKLNMIECKHCKQIIESKHRHDFRYCKCQAVFVDGGKDYLRRGFKTNPEDDYLELSQYEDDK